MRGHWVQFWEHYDGFVVNASRCVCHHTRGITLREVMVSGLPHADSDASVFIRT